MVALFKVALVDVQIRFICEKRLLSHYALEIATLLTAVKRSFNSCVTSPNVSLNTLKV